jgi:hypothetical protein
VRRIDVLLAVSLAIAVAWHIARAAREMTWRGPAPGLHGQLVRPAEVGGRWLLESAKAPVTDPGASRLAALARARSLGLRPSGEAKSGSPNRPPVPGIVRLRGGGHALLLERAPHVARLHDPARGEVLLMGRDLGRWLDGHAEPLEEGP